MTDLATLTRKPLDAEEASMTALHLTAPNDSNGNPRRCYVVLSSNGAVHEVIDEGYEGRRALTSRYPDLELYWEPEILVSGKEYKRYLSYPSHTTIEHVKTKLAS